MATLNKRRKHQQDGISDVSQSQSIDSGSTFDDTSNYTVKQLLSYTQQLLNNKQYKKLSSVFNYNNIVNTYNYNDNTIIDYINILHIYIILSIQLQNIDNTTIYKFIQLISQHYKNSQLDSILLLSHIITKYESYKQYNECIELLELLDQYINYDDSNKLSIFTQRNLIHLYNKVKNYNAISQILSQQPTIDKRSTYLTQLIQNCIQYKQYNALYTLYDSDKIVIKQCILDWLYNKMVTNDLLDSVINIVQFLIQSNDDTTYILNLLYITYNKYNYMLNQYNMQFIYDNQYFLLQLIKYIYNDYNKPFICQYNNTTIIVTMNKIDKLLDKLKIKLQLLNVVNDDDKKQLLTTDKSNIDQLHLLAKQYNVAI